MKKFLLLLFLTVLFPISLFATEIEIKMISIKENLYLKITNKSAQWSFIPFDLKGLPTVFFIVSSQGNIVKDRRWGLSTSRDRSLALSPNDDTLLIVPYFPQDQAFSFVHPGRYFVFALLRDPLNHKKILVSNPGSFVFDSAKIAGSTELSKDQIPQNVADALHTFLSSLSPGNSPFSR